MQKTTVFFGVFVTEGTAYTGDKKTAPERNLEAVSVDRIDAIILSNTAFLLNLQKTTMKNGE